MYIYSIYVYRPPKFSCYTILYVLLLYVSYGDIHVLSQYDDIEYPVCEKDLRQQTNNSMMLCRSTNHNNTHTNFGRLQRTLWSKTFHVRLEVTHCCITCHQEGFHSDASLRRQAVQVKKKKKKIYYYYYYCNAY